MERAKANERSGLGEKANRRSDVQELVFAALRSLGTPPCVKFSCTFSQRCASEKLACAAFSYYLETGRAINPRSDPSNRGKNHKPVLLESAAPTRAIYEGL